MDIAEIRTKTMSMADKVYDIVGLVEKGFTENRLEPLTGAMKEEDEVNGMEKALTICILESSKSAKGEKEKRALSTWEGVVEMLERMGDEAASLIERIEIKVDEKLLFSDTGVEQFDETYGVMKRSVEMMRDYLKEQSPALKERIIDNGFHVKELVERYRKEHTDRLIQGICSPIAANMFFDMLDFTGNLARHASNIVKLF